MNGDLIMEILYGIFILAFGLACVWGTFEMIKPLEASKSKK